MSELQNTQNWYDGRLPDNGPVYAETNPEQWIVEPWNAASSLMMMIPAIIWAIKLYPHYKQYGFLTFLLPLGFLGGLGSTLFHAFRTSTFFLILDVLPTAILTLSLTIYFWTKILRRWWYVFFVIAISFAIRFFLFTANLPDHTAINLSYGLTGIFIGLPLIVIIYKTQYRQLFAVVVAILSFILALTFRELDAYPFTLLPMGTHFLWHAFSAIGSYVMFQYLYYLGSVQTLNKSPQKEPIGLKI